MNARSLALLCLPLSALLFAACGEDEAAPKQPTSRKGGNGGASGNGGGEDAGTGGDEGGGNTSSKGGSGGGTLTCKKHSACEPGEKLVRACSLCIQQVCDITPTCCGEEWDENCVASAQRVPVCDCGEAPAGGAGGASGGGGPGGAAGSGPVTCHDACVEGSRLDASCGTCAANVCKLDKFCCENTWDAQCVLKASNVAEGCDCEEIELCHSPCEAGLPLTVECDPCVADVCGAEPSCCDVGWDAVYCVELAKEACNVCKTPQGGAGGASGSAGKGGAGGGGSKKCPENPCIPGGKAVAAASCNACIETVIAAKPTCADGWKQGCADLAKTDPTCGCPGAGGAGGAAGAGGGAAKGGAAGAAGKGGSTGGSAGKAGASGTAGAGGATGDRCPADACTTNSPVSQTAGFCDLCSGSICSDHPECCSASTWTAACSAFARGSYAPVCGCGPDLSACKHDVCTKGPFMIPSCDPCVKRLCEVDTACCKDVDSGTEWDGYCINGWTKLINDGDPACKGYNTCPPSSVP